MLTEFCRNLREILILAQLMRHFVFFGKFGRILGEILLSGIWGERDGWGQSTPAREVPRPRIGGKGGMACDRYKTVAKTSYVKIYRSSTPETVSICLMLPKVIHWIREPVANTNYVSLPEFNPRDCVHYSCCQTSSTGRSSIPKTVCIYNMMPKIIH